jgi:hypothetical protein
MAPVARKHIVTERDGSPASTTELIYRMLRYGQDYVDIGEKAYAAQSNRGALGSLHVVLNRAQAPSDVHEFAGRSERARAAKSSR